MQNDIEILNYWKNRNFENERTYKRACRIIYNGHSCACSKETLNKPVPDPILASPEQKEFAARPATCQ